MLIPPSVNATPHFSQPSPSPLASTSSNASSHSPVSTTTSAFERLLVQQISHSDSPPTRSPSVSVQPAENGAYAPTEPLSYLAMNGFISTAPVPAQLVTSTAGTKQAPESAPTTGSSNGSTAGEPPTNGDTGSVSRLTTWQSAADQRLFTSLAASLFASAINAGDEADSTERSTVQGLPANVLAKGIFSPNRLANGLESNSGSEDGYLQINEFSVETTSAETNGTANVESTVVAQPSESANRVATSAQSANSLQRAANEKDSTIAANSALIPVAASSSASGPVDEVPLSEELKNVVTRQLEQEISSGVTTVRIQLDRQDLGSVSLFLSISNNIVRVRIVAQDEIARQLIESQMDELRQALSESDVECSEFLVTSDSTDQHSPRRKRTAQPLIALGFTSHSRDLLSDEKPVTSGFSASQFNFSA